MHSTLSTVDKVERVEFDFVASDYGAQGSIGWLQLRELNGGLL